MIYELHFKPITDSPDRLNILWFCGVLLDLLTNLLDMYRNSSDITDGFHIPDLTEELFFGKNMIGILGQERQKIKLLGGEVSLLTVHPEPPGGLVDLDPPDLNDVVFLRIASYQPVIPGHMGFHPGYQFTGAEGLRHIIIGAKPKAPDLVYVVFLR